MTNLYACLVHERPDCVLDLVRNLRALDSVSPILLYNGGRNKNLLAGIPELERLGAVCHPAPSEMRWGKLHGFALDCMRFGLDEFDFGAMTIVDSDQMMVRSGYPKRIEARFAEDDRIGLLGNSAQRQDVTTKVPPCVTAHEETELWKPFLRQFEGGMEKWVHWSFWPSTVIRAEACREILSLFDTSRPLNDILRRSRLWATEELLFPTITSLLGYKVAVNPASYDYVKYRARYTSRQISKALRQDDVYWIHPVRRHLGDPVRTLIRSRTLPEHAGDGHAGVLTDRLSGPAGTYQSEAPPWDNVPLLLPLVQRMRSIDGWLEVDEADLVMGAATKALTGALRKHSIVEIGSYCGRATFLLASLAKALDAPTKVVAIDTFDGIVGAADGRLERRRPTLDRFRSTLATTGIEDQVCVIVGASGEVEWDRPVSLLLIDGLHDYDNVSADFRRFEPHLRKGSLILFHDYARYYPGVMRFVDELLSDPGYERVGLVRSMMLVRRTKAASTTRSGAGSRGPKTGTPEKRNAPRTPQPPEPRGTVETELVSCIMPTNNRRPFVPEAIKQFLRQSYPTKELIVLDDGDDPIEDLIPDGFPIRYVRLPRRLSVGRKRNMGVELALGNLIAHWDDDDWYRRDRLALQVEALRDATCKVSGLDRVLFAEPNSGAAWRYRYPSGGRPWVYGATLMYRKETWKRTSFPDVNEGEDTRFVWSVGAGVRAHPDPSWFVGRIHTGNTSKKRTNSARWTPVDAAEITTETGGEWSLLDWTTDEHT